MHPPLSTCATAFHTNKNYFANSTTSLKNKTKKSEIFFVPVFLTNGKDRGNNLNLCRFVNLAAKGDFKSVNNQLIRGICDQLAKPGLPVSKNITECFKTINKQSWYKYAACAMGVEISIDHASETSGATLKKSACQGLNGLKLSLTKIDPKNLKIVRLYLDTIYPQDTTCYAAADSNIIKIIEPINKQRAFFYRDKNGKIKALISHIDNLREILDFSQLDIKADTHKNIEFPLRGIQEISSFNFFLAYKEKIQSAIELFNLQNKLQQRKCESEMIPILQSTQKLKEIKPLLFKRMKLVLLPEMKMMEKTRVLLLLTGLLDQGSQLSKMPKEMILEIIQKLFGLAVQRLEDLE